MNSGASSSQQATTDNVTNASTKVVNTTPQTISNESNEILHRRMVTREGGGVEIQCGTLSKAASQFQKFVRHALSLSENGTNNKVVSTEETEKIVASLKRELLLHGIEMSKMKFISRSVDTELREYDRLQQEMEESISRNRSDIESLHNQLKHEKLVRRNREEYEAMAKLATVHPPRRETNFKLEAIRKKITDIREEEKKLDKYLEIREKQFQLLLQSIFDLKSTLSEEDKDEQIQGEEQNSPDVANEEVNVDTADITPMDTSL